MINKVILLGNLGRDPEMKATSTGQSIGLLNLATTERWKNKAGEQQEITDWHKIVVYGKLADIVGQYCKKGTRLYVEGQIKTRKWQDKSTGEDKYTTEVVVSDRGVIKMLGGNEGQSNPQPKKQDAQIKVAEVAEGFADEIPF